MKSSAFQGSFNGHELGTYLGCGVDASENLMGRTRKLARQQRAWDPTPLSQRAEVPRGRVALVDILIHRLQLRVL